MQNVFRSSVIIASLMGIASVLSAQQIDWRNYDPKKASPAEAERVNRFLEENYKRYLGKTAGEPSEIRSAIMRGNKITTIVYNYGNITRPTLRPPNLLDLVWNRLGYGFEFTPLLAGEVIKGSDTIRILNDGMWLPSQGGYAPDGSIKWGWLPKRGYAAPGQPDIASWSHRADVQGDLTRKPHSWPEAWYNSVLGRYVWPAFLGSDATTPDEEVYFVVDDYTNAKYPYYPFPNDSSKRGLGLDMEVRFFQFNNPLAEDIIFLVYRVTNRSPKTINRTWFGVYGDPHVGGTSDYADDRAFFIPPKGPLADQYPQRARSMVYAYDDDMRGDGGLPAGYFGLKFLESPTNSNDGIDNDDDGIIDESPFNDAGFYIDGINVPLTFGIADTAKYTALYGAPKPRWSGDENGNWDPTKHDVGLDGIPGTGDFGEGNGKPDIGFDAEGNLVAEPNFGIRDVNESDQIGLTSFWALEYTNSLPNVPKNDIFFWQLLSSDSISTGPSNELLNRPGDNVLVFGSGPFTLEPGATQRFSIALMMGNDLQDLLLNAETAQRVLEANYQFAAPPPKPNVTAVAGDKKVTLYWDTIAEDAVDPLTNLNDFEGYKIYRSEDPTFADVFTITDANGNPFLGKPMQQQGILAQFDLVNEWSGLHPVEYLGRGVKYNLGSNTGLVHEYVDSSVFNGRTYYYAVVSYDHGSTLFGVEFAPSESQASIKQDPVTNEIQFDVNTVGVTPGPLPSGYSPAMVGVNFLAERINGISTGPVFVKVLDDLAVPDGLTYQVDFFLKDSLTLAYNVRSLSYSTDRIQSRDTLFVPLGKRNIDVPSVVVRGASGNVVDPSNYVVDGPRGLIRGTLAGALPSGAAFDVTYQYFAVFLSTRFNNEDDNSTFDGMKIYVKDVPLGIDSTNSGWIMVNNTNLAARVHKPVTLGASPFTPVPRDFEIRWNSTDTTAAGKWASPADTVLTATGQRIVVVPFKIYNVSDAAGFRVVVGGATADSMWRPGREIVILSPDNPIRTYVSATFSAPSTGQAVLPTQGNVYVVRSSRPFEPGDQYQFTTQAVKFDEARAKNELDNIYVVPNPYVVYSTLEGLGRTATRRGESNLQFRNLPPKCTIRIYTMVGELVDTIVKDDNKSHADWSLLSYEGHRLAYGIYIYHVEVPGVGEKIGRFALIK
ncbi:MAG: hypothetical protein HYW57_03135 [Ignavibacteriales bacterium]|nr:hypothetical protein [Ignavibacteriales bacterium]